MTPAEFADLLESSGGNVRADTWPQMGNAQRF